MRTRRPRFANSDRAGRLLHRDRSGLGDQPKTDLPPASELDIDLREKLRVEQRAVLHAVAAVDPEAHAQARRGCASRPGACDRASVSVSTMRLHRHRRTGRSVSSSKLRKPKSKLGIVGDQRRILDEVEQLVDLFDEARLVGQEDRGQAVHRLGFERHVALGIEIAVEMPAGFDAVEDLDAADLDHAVAADRVEPGRLGIEHDLPHGRNLSAAADSQTSENVAHLAFCCG